MAKNSVLVVDKDAMNKAKTELLAYSKRMTDLKNKLTEVVDGIRVDWDSDGGKAFFKKFDDEWFKNFNDYIAVIEHMAENITTALNKYQTVFEEAEKLNLK